MKSNEQITTTGNIEELETEDYIGLIVKDTNNTKQDDLVDLKFSIFDDKELKQKSLDYFIYIQIMHIIISLFTIIPIIIINNNNYSFQLKWIPYACMTAIIMISIVSYLLRNFIYNIPPIVTILIFIVYFVFYIVFNIFSSFLVFNITLGVLYIILTSAIILLISNTISILEDKPHIQLYCVYLAIFLFVIIFKAFFRQLFVEFFILALVFCLYYAFIVHLLKKLIIEYIVEVEKNLDRNEGFPKLSLLIAVFLNIDLFVFSITNLKNSLKTNNANPIH